MGFLWDSVGLNGLNGFKLDLMGFDGFKPTDSEQTKKSDGCTGIFRSTSGR